jgi:predicted phage terminase large subunit-like protein
MAKRAPAPPPTKEREKVQTYAKQAAFIKCDAPIRAFTGGVGSGKSQSGAIDMLMKSKPNSLYMVCSPTYGMLHDATLRTFVDVATKMDLWDPSQYWTQPRPRAICKNGAEYLFRSMDDPDSLRGPNASGVWMDEVQKTTEESYTILLGRLREHGKRGWLTATFTPGSPDHWTSRTFIGGCQPAETVVMTTKGPVTLQYYRSADGDVAFFRASLKENTFLDPGFYQGLMRAYAASPLRIERELEGKCVFLEGAEWDASYFQDAWFDEWPDLGRHGLKVLALDSSKGKGGKTGDYSAFVKLMFVDGLLYVDADMRNDRDSTVISQTGVELYLDWLPHYFVVEEEMGQDLLIADMHKIADARGIILPIVPMGTDKINKEVRIRRLTPYVSRRQFRFKSNSPGAKLLVEQMTSFPLGEHDDGPDSLEYGVRMLIKATTGQVLPPRGYNFTPTGGIAV